MRTKEFLSTRGVDFDSVNVADNESGLADLHSLGARSVPVVAKDKQFIYAQDLNQVAQFVGLPDKVQPGLSPEQLIKGCKRILYVAGVAVNQIPGTRLEEKFPGRNRSYLSLANHLFAIGEGLARVVQGEDFSGSIAAATPKTNRFTADLRTIGQQVTTRLEHWFQGTKDPQCQRQVTTYYGPQSLHAVLERHTWHMTQHLRQIMLILNQLDIEPEAPLIEADLEGLPLPDQVWD